MLAALALASCRRFALPDVPIVGGTAWERRIVREELVAFDRAIGEDRLEVATVRIRDPGPDNRGRAVGRRIEVLPGMPEVELRYTVRHELCHVLDHAEGLLDPPTRPFTGLVGLVEAREPAGRDDREVMAVYCGLGPLTARMLADPCPADDPDGNAVAAWLISEVYQAYDAADRVLVPRGSFETGAPLESYAVVGMSADTPMIGVLHRRIGSTDPTHELDLVDPWSGAPAAGDHGWLPDEPIPDASPPEYVHPIEDEYGLAALAVASSAGELAAFYGVNSVDYYYGPPDSWTPIGGAAGRVLVWNGEDWSIVRGGCMQAPEDPALRSQVFTTADGRLWVAWVEGGTRIAWGDIGAD